MGIGFYPHLAWDSIRKNRRFYLPYILTCTGMVMMFYIIAFLAGDPLLKTIRGGSFMAEMLGMGTYVIMIFAVLFLFYTNSFLMKKRKKEFGLYNVLGMGKGNLARILFWESVQIAFISLTAGLMFGIVFAKLGELAMMYAIKGENNYNITVNTEALFMTLKDTHGGCSWWQWEDELKRRDHLAIDKVRETMAEQIAFWKVLQYFFFRQWKSLKQYVNDKGIDFIGDLPIYVSQDSVDVWAHPELFQLDENLMPKEVSGCPPDGFSATGQLWGNPLFDWDKMAEDDYAWWVGRIDYFCHIYDVLRIDHFRGFDSYFAIPYGAETAKDGYWKQGPGMKLFNAVEAKIGKQPIIAEDLGFLTDSVKKLLADSGFPGMKVFELGFDSRDTNGNGYQPHNFIRDCVAYTGTHDNDTIQGWFASADPVDTEWAREYFRLTKEEGYHWGMMRALWGSVADTAIVQAQDLLGLGSEARMNEPSTVGRNWQWRALPGVFTEELAQKIHRMMVLYERVN